MNFLRRLKLFGFGFGMGLVIVYMMFGTRSCVTPNEQKMIELRYQYFQVSEKVQCKLKCLNKNELLLKIELRHFEVNYDVSAVRKEPCGEYYVEPKKEFADKYNYKLIMYDCDTITKINDISIINSNTCNCQ